MNFVCNKILNLNKNIFYEFYTKFFEIFYKSLRNYSIIVDKKF